MEFLIILLPLFIISYMVGRKFVNPYLLGTKQIDHLKYPTLARAQSIHRYSNVKAREIEARTKWTHFDTKRLEVTKAIDKAIEDNRLENRDKHWTEIKEWEDHFKAITAAEDARKAAAAEKIAAAKRAKGMEVWTVNEKARLARFNAEQAYIKAAEDRKATALLQSRENDIQALSAHHVGGPANPANAHRLVIVHGLYVRKLPTKYSRIVDNLENNSWVTVNGWISYEEVYGNPIWFRLADGKGWIWSGGVNSKATSALENLNHWSTEGDSFTMKNAMGQVIWGHSEPSRLQGLIVQEMSDQRRENQLANKRVLESTTPPDNVTRSEIARVQEQWDHYMSISEKEPNFWRGTAFENM